MALSRKRRKELNRLKNQAETLWEDQKELLEHASRVVRDASRQAANYAREEVTPRVRDTYEDRVRPVMRSSVAGARSAASSTRDRFVDDVLPAMSSALGTAMAAIDVAKNRQVRDVIARAARISGGSPAVPTKSSGPGRYILIGVGVVATLAVAYAAWQTLRADDDLWIEDDVTN